MQLSEDGLFLLLSSTLHMGCFTCWLGDHFIWGTRMFGDDIERCELNSHGMEKMQWGFEGVEPLWGTLLLASYFADWLNIQFKTWYFQLSSVKICKPFKARTASLYGIWHDGTAVPDASKCMCIVFLVWLCIFPPSTFGNGVVIPVVVYDCLNGSGLLGFMKHN